MTEPQPARLAIREPLAGVPEVILLGETSTIGRHPNNTIVLGTDSVSRFHARIERRGSYYLLVDLNSSNGTFVNGERVMQRTLQHNDEVTFGSIEFLFLNEGSTPSWGQDFSGGGMSIVEFREDAEDEAPMSHSVIPASRIDEIRERSSFFTTPLPEQKAATVDRPTLLKMHNRLSALFKLSEMLREAEGDSDTIIVERALEIIFHAVDADRGIILTRFAPESKDLDIGAMRHREQHIPGTRMSISRTIVNKVINEKVAVLSTNAAIDSRFTGTESIMMNKMVSVICVPMLSQDIVMGVIHLDSQNQSRTFDENDLEFVTMIATDLSMALDNLRMRREAAHRARLAAVGETVAGISHNIKNILLLMQGGSELLSRALDNKAVDQAGESWGVVNRGIDKISRLVKDMLEYSSNKRPKLKDVDVNDMICKTAEDIEEQLLSKGITLELDLDDELKPRPLDELGIQRTIMNLIVNSMEAITHSSGHIFVSTSLHKDADEMLVIRVGDNGQGIPPEKLDRIFMPFFTTKGSTGTGLGLPMCRKVVEDHGGTISVESEENVGTTFTIRLPRITQSSDTAVGREHNETLTEEH